jgi:hypothetical protein
MPMLESIILALDKIKDHFYYNKSDFFTLTNKNDRVIDILNLEYFDKVKRIIQTCYINIEILMTRNKLLFADATDEYATDEEIQKEIIEEYTEG